MSLCPPTQLSRHWDGNQPPAQVVLCVSAIALQVAAYVGFKPKCLHPVKSHLRGRVIPCNASWMWAGRCLRGWDRCSEPAPRREEWATAAPPVIGEDCICPKPLICPKPFLKWKHILNGLSSS